MHRWAPPAAPPRFVESLSEVASAISSRSSIDDILLRVVDEAKTLVRCRKALVCMFDGSGGTTLGTVIVRGNRDQYPEAWWTGLMEGAAAQMSDLASPVVLREREFDASIACVPLRVQGRAVGLLAAINSYARSFSEAQIMLLAVLGAFAGVAIENARLRAQSEYALLADERNRIAKEMHDGLAQSLFSASLALEVAKRRVRSAPEDVEERLRSTQLVLSESLTELRRYIYDLRPVSLERLGLAGAISKKIDEIVQAGRIAGDLFVHGEERQLEPGAEACLYRVMQESLANVVKHSGAEHFAITLDCRDDSIMLTIEDDGIGFEVDVAQLRAETTGSLGLRSMRDRVAAESGTLHIISAPGEGTTIRVTLPC